MVGLKHIALYFLAAFAKPFGGLKRDPQQQAEEDGATLANPAKLFNEEKREYLKEWQKPENIEKRHKEFYAMAAEALERGKKMSGRELEPLPPIEELPDEVKIQQPSMQRIMLKKLGWKYDWEDKTWIN